MMQPNRPNVLVLSQMPARLPCLVRYKLSTSAHDDAARSVHAQLMVYTSSYRVCLILSSTAPGMAGALVGPHVERGEGDVAAGVLLHKVLADAARPALTQPPRWFVATQPDKLPGSSCASANVIQNVLAGTHIIRTG